MTTAYSRSRIYPFVFAIIGAVLGLIGATTMLFTSSRVPFGKVSVADGLLGSFAFNLLTSFAGGIGGLLLG